MTIPFSDQLKIIEALQQKEKAPYMQTTHYNSETKRVFAECEFGAIEFTADCVLETGCYPTTKISKFFAEAAKAKKPVKKTKTKYKYGRISVTLPTQEAVVAHDPFGNRPDEEVSVAVASWQLGFRQAQSFWRADNVQSEIFIQGTWLYAHDQIGIYRCELLQNNQLFFKFSGAACRAMELFLAHAEEATFYQQNGSLYIVADDARLCVYGVADESVIQKHPIKSLFDMKAEELELDWKFIKEEMKSYQKFNSTTAVFDQNKIVSRDGEVVIDLEGELTHPFAVDPKRLMDVLDALSEPVAAITPAALLFSDPTKQTQILVARVTVQ